MTQIEDISTHNDAVSSRITYYIDTGQEYAAEQHNINCENWHSLR